MDTRRGPADTPDSPRPRRALIKITAALAVAAALAYLPEHPGLSADGRMSLLILVLAAGLWISEAIPAFAVALLVIALQVLLLASPAGPGSSDDWQTFTRAWAAPPMWLFLAGLIMAKAAERTGIARWIADTALGVTGGHGAGVLIAAMGVTFLFSMFISNTATTALMVAVLGSVGVAGRSATPQARRALLIGVAFAANVGGMATLIGTPPNAIAAGLLDDVRAVSFLTWMLFGLPPALLVVGGLAAALALRSAVRGAQFSLPPPAAQTAAVPLASRLAVMAIFTITILAWLSEAWHGLPTAVVAFLPIVALSAIGVIRREEIRSLPWDVLILIAGGLSLGVGVAESGLAGWLAHQVAELAAPVWAIALVLCYLTSALSNLMSNTAAANLLLPIVIALGLELGGALLAVQLAVPIALAASSAMCMPISTPPNAIVHATGAIGSLDFLRGGLAVAVLVPPVAVGWCFAVAGWLWG